MSPSVTFFSQVRWFVQTSDGASYVTCGGHEYPVPLVPHTLKPSFARCIWRSYTGSLPDHPFAPIPFHSYPRIRAVERLWQLGARVNLRVRVTDNNTTEFPEPFPAG